MRVILSSCKKFRAVIEEGGNRFQVSRRINEEGVGEILKGETAYPQYVFKPYNTDMVFTATELMDLSCLVSTCRLTLEPWLDPFQEPE